MCSDGVHLHFPIDKKKEKQILKDHPMNPVQQFIYKKEFLNIFHIGWQKSHFSYQHEKTL
jgi:hypothetical protein